VGDALIRLEKWTCRHTDRWVDIRKLKGAFREHAKAPKNSSPCPRYVFLLCVWFSEQTANISVYSSVNCCEKGACSLLPRYPKENSFVLKFPGFAGLSYL